MQQTKHLPQIPKKTIDRILERLRFTKAKSYIPKGTRLLDIGTGDGTFPRFLDRHIAAAIGIVPLITTPLHLKNTRYCRGLFLTILKQKPTLMLSQCSQSQNISTLNRSCQLKEINLFLICLQARMKINR